MNKFFRKMLIYLILSVIAVPVSVSSGWMTATKVMAGAPDVIINEVNWAGSSASSNDEWLELRNMTASPIDISSWIIKNAGTSSTDLVIPAGKIIPADGYFLISNYVKGSVDTVLNVAPDWVTSSLSLNNSPTNNLILTRSDTTVEDTVGVSGSNWPAGSNNTPKASMSRKTTPSDGAIASNWFTSYFQRELVSGASDLGTPGSLNIPQLTSSHLVSNNSTTAGYAKVLDNVTLTVSFDGTVLSPTATIAGHSVNVSPLGNNSFSAALLMSDSDSNGPIPFGIDFTDIAGNQSQTYSTTTDSSSVIFDKTKPAALTSQYYSVQSYLGENGEKLLDVKGTTEPNMTVTLDIETVPTQAGVSTSFVANADANGNFEVPAANVTSLNVAKVSVTPTVTDLAGNSTTSGSGLNAVFNAQNDPTVNALGDAISLDFSSGYTSSSFDLGGVINPDSTVDFTGGMFVRRELDGGNFEMTIQPKTVMNAGSQFFDLPNVVQGIIKPSMVGAINGPVEYIGIGSETANFTFDIPVKLVFKNKDNNHVGFVKNGQFTEITQLCGSDLLNPILSVTGECKAVVGSDLIVLTKHFTQFATYSQSLIVPVISSATNVQKNGNNYIDIAWNNTGADSYEVYVDGILAATVTSASVEVQVTSAGPHTVRVRAKVGSHYSDYSGQVTVNVAPIAPSPSSAGTYTPISTSSHLTPLVSSAQAAAPAPAPAPVATVAPAPAAASDSNGIVKAAQNTAAATETTNWTPWIVLLTLIVLAGAVTGGYFYWYAGREELAVATNKDVKKIKKMAQPTKPVTVTVKEKSKTPKKKPNRW